MNIPFMQTLAAYDKCQCVLFQLPSNCDLRSNCHFPCGFFFNTGVSVADSWFTHTEQRTYSVQTEVLETA